MTFRPTEGQRTAIEALDGELFIHAGAGSGKTAVLARRFAEAVARGADVDALLAITFTRKAASELAERVRHVLRHERGLPEAALSLRHAWISTIHGFCARILRRHALEAGVCPGFRVADEAEAGVLRAEAFESAAAALSADADAVGLIALFGAARLRSTLLALHGKVRSLAADPAALPEPHRPDLTAALGRTARVLEDVLASHPSPPANATQRANADALRSALAALQGAAQGAGSESVTAESVLEAVAACRPTRRCRATAAAISDARSALLELADAAHAVGLRSHGLGMVRLMRAFHERYREAKDAAGLLDQDDLQEATERLFRERPEVAEEYAGAFGLVMVDEFQDTNELQVRVIEPLRRDDLCVVGDERQAIYSFRDADVEVFRRVRAGIVRALPLDVNFRSHPEIVVFMNGLFSAGALFGGGHEPLRPGAEARELPGVDAAAPRAEVSLVAREGWEDRTWREAEARVLARRLAELVRGGVPRSDVVVLLRALTCAGPFLSALEEQGLPAIVTGGGSFAAQPEVLELEALIGVATLPHDSESLTTLLLGDLVGLSGGALLGIRELAEGRALWEAVGAAAEGEGRLSEEDRSRLRVLREAVAAIRERGRRRGLGDSLVSAVRELGLRERLLAGGPAGERAWANVRKLVRMAEEFGHDETPDPSAFVRRLRAVRAYGRTAQASPAAADAVRLMSVHSAKGLEFPVVAVADLGRQLPRPDDLAIAALRAGRLEWSLALPASRTGQEGYVPLEHERLRLEERQRSLAEEKRLLYVACTRAEDMLILSGATSLDAAEREDRPVAWLRAALGCGDRVGEGGERAVARARYTLSVTRPGGLPSGSAPSGTPGRPSAQAPEAVAASLASHAPSPAARPEGAPRGEATPGGPAAVPARAGTAAVLSYTALNAFAACPYRFYVERVLGIRNPPAGPLAFGAAVHAALRSVETGPPSLERLRAIAAAHELPAEDVARLQAAVTAFSQSPLAARVASGDRVGREVPFALPIAGSHLVGSMDVVSWRGRSALVVDYKTGASAHRVSTKPAPGVPVTAGESPNGARRLQAECYALALLQAGAAEVEVAFAELEGGGESTPILFATEDAGDLRGRLEEAVRAATSGSFPRLGRYDPGVCAECPAFGGLCGISGPPRRARDAA